MEVVAEGEGDARVGFDCVCDYCVAASGEAVKDVREDLCAGLFFLVAV